ncbi:type II toxin-antitoxin system VapC family toxin [Planctobacterium marinum]|uniref:Twitching motility protein PilT n=1 Tax=Planctobacterium marinum TaxID=1631968 RepID=A0AA48HYV3_9ALTE|nr:twitching motility protein PilT [Planctobacterium marinum]
MVLVDTSVWVAHFKGSNDTLIDLLNTDEVCCHPLRIAELTCGTPPEPRSKTLKDLSLLRTVTIATMREVLAFIEERALYGKGCGYIDIALLASALLSNSTKLWTLDKRLSKLAEELNIKYL